MVKIGKNRDSRAVLTAEAISACKNSYSPYSHFPVGAAILTSSGAVFTGCNVENASYGDTICAERAAVFKAVSEGYTEFTEMAIYTFDSERGQNLIPCGSCLQVLSEFCKKDFIIYCKCRDGEIRQYTLGELLPEGFRL